MEPTTSSPTNIPTTTSPTDSLTTESPTEQPTAVPTAPTVAPTRMQCNQARYMGNMSLSAGDALLNNESLSSNDCNCKLLLSGGGNLMLSELNDGQWQLIWQTSTVIF